MYVTAILPPGNIQAAIENVKKRIFAEYRIASIYAMPPMIPLHLSDLPVEPPASHSIIRQPAAYETDTLALDSGLIVAPPCHMLDVTGITDALAPLPPTAEHPLFAAPPELVLGVGGPDSTVDPAGFEGFLGTLLASPLRFRRSEIGCFEVSTHGGDPWWIRVSLRYLWRRPLKLPAS